MTHQGTDARSGEIGDVNYAKVGQRRLRADDSGNYKRAARDNRAERVREHVLEHQSAVRRAERARGQARIPVL